MQNIVYISIDGIIGAGKTTYLKHLTETLKTNYGFNVHVVQEPVNEWKSSGILGLFYADMSRWGYSFQTKAFHDRVFENIKAYKTYGDDVDIYISERSCLSDRFFMEMLHKDGHITDLEMKMYEQWTAMWEYVMPYKHDHIVYVRTELDTCMQRIKERDIAEEQNITREYQDNLMKEHDNVLLHGTYKDKTYVVDLSIDYRGNPPILNKMVKDFVDMLLNSLKISNPEMKEKLERKMKQIS